MIVIRTKKENPLAMQGEGAFKIVQLPTSVERLNYTKTSSQLQGAFSCFYMGGAANV